MKHIVVVSVLALVGCKPASQGSDVKSIPCPGTASTKCRSSEINNSWVKRYSYKPYSSAMYKQDFGHILGPNIYGTGGVPANITPVETFPVTTKGSLMTFIANVSSIGTGEAGPILLNSRVSVLTPNQVVLQTTYQENCGVPPTTVSIAIPKPFGPAEVCGEYWLRDAWVIPMAAYMYDGNSRLKEFVDRHLRVNMQSVYFNPGTNIGGYRRDIICRKREVSFVGNYVTGEYRTKCDKSQVTVTSSFVLSNGFAWADINNNQVQVVTAK